MVSFVCGIKFTYDRLFIVHLFSVASNAFGKVESVGHVHIVGPSVKGGKCPLFQSRPETEMLIMTGDPFSLSFRIIGEPKPKCKEIVVHSFIVE